MKREPTTEEMRLVEAFSSALLTQPQHGGGPACALHLVRAIIDALRVMPPAAREAAELVMRHCLVSKSNIAEIYWPAALRGISPPV